jgi:putative transposase
MNDSLPEDRAESLRGVGRRSPAHLPLMNRPCDGNILFMTVCSADKKPLFAREDIHNLLRAVWNDSSNAWLMGRYVLMPDHLHFFCSPRSFDAPGLNLWMRWWRTQATQGWPRPNEKPLWQRDYWDTQLRHDESYEGKWHYVRDNPVRAGLARPADEWPYQGEIHRLGFM